MNFCLQFSIMKSDLINRLNVQLKRAIRKRQADLYGHIYAHIEKVGFLSFIADVERRHLGSL